MNWHNSLEAQHERLERRIAPPAPRSHGARNPDLKHCLAVLRASGGKSFPFYQEQAA